MSGGLKDVRRGLEPLEFEECIVDSPEFRDNLTRHEKELDHTSHQIKRIIKEVKDLINAAKVLTTRMKQLAYSLKDFNFECIGTAQTDDELVICESLKHFGDIINTIEDEREKMLTLADKHIIEPLEDFRKKQIGGVKENKKKFDKKTEKFCQSQERFLNMSTKKPENTIQEADASLGMHEREYVQESLSYVLRIQEVQERIKFEFVEILLAFISSWLVFYHTAHEQAEDNRDYLQDLRHKVQKTRENFEEAREKVTELKLKYMEKRTKPEEKFTKRGYLFLMEKKPFKANWTKFYCTYKKQKKEFTLLQFNQISHIFTKPIEHREEEKLTLMSCQRRASEFEKRFCFDLTFKEKIGVVYTFQALSEEDRRAWINAMDGTEPTYLASGKPKAGEDYQLDEIGFAFVRKCIEVLEARGLEDEGIYRKSGVGTKIHKLLSLGMDRKGIDTVFIDEQYRDLMESNTIASALKTYLRNLNEPLMTYRYHSNFIEAAKQENLNQRVHEVHKLVYKLPQSNFEMLDMVMKHLTEVARKFNKNKMSVFNLGVVFGPTLLRPQEETVAAILDIKFNNIVINILIENYERIFKHDPSAVEDLTIKHTATPSPRISKLTQSSGSKNSIGVGVGGAYLICSDGGSIGRNSIYSTAQQQHQQPQQIYQILPNSNFGDLTISSSLQNIPSSVNHVYNGSGCSGGGAGSGSGALLSNTSIDNTTTNSCSGGHLSLLKNTSSNVGAANSGPRSLGITINMGSVKNIHSMSQSDISNRRTGSTSDAFYSILSSSTNGGLTAHHATPANTTNLRHEYLMGNAASATTATTNTISTSASPSSGVKSISSCSSHMYTTCNIIANHPKSNVSPPTVALRKESTYGSNVGPQQHPPVQLQRSNHLLNPKHYSTATAHSNSSSNESVCDSLNSNNGGSNNGGSSNSTITASCLLTTKNSIDYVPHSVQNANMCNFLSSNCDNVTPTTKTNNTSSPPTDYKPQKMYRNRDVNRIKRNLDAGTARVRTLYACLGESEGELSFEPNQIITNVGFSHEPGWLQGTLDGKTGLIPENYVEHLKPYH